MKSHYMVMAILAILVSGCTTTTNQVPYTSAERYSYRHGYIEDPHETCELGYQKIYYVVKKQAEQGGNAVLTMSNCLSPEHIAQLKELSTVRPETNVDDAEDNTVEIVDAFRIPPPDLSQKGFSQAQPIEEISEVTAESTN